MIHAAEVRRKQAAGLLLHYIGLAADGKLRSLNADNRLEIASIVDLIIQAAVLEIRSELAALPIPEKPRERKPDPDTQGGKAQEHEWTVVVETSSHSLHTCVRCGIFRLGTLSSEFYLTALDGPQTTCRTFPYRGGKA